MSIISDSLKRIKPSPTIAVTQKARELRAAGKDVIGLGAGEPDFDTPNNIKNAAIKAIRRGDTKYTAVDGTPALKKAIIKKFKKENNLRYSNEEITVGTGGKQVLYNAFMATLNRGDEVIIPAPFWVSYPDMVLLAGGKPKIVKCNESDNFKLTPQKLRKAISKKTKWLILNSPSNPTGVSYTKAEIKKLSQVLIKNKKIQILSDDIYEHITYDKAKFFTIAQISSLKNRTLTMNGVSKSYAMTGWRIGWMIVPGAHVRTIEKLAQNMFICAPHVSQVAALAALDTIADAENLKAVYKTNRRILMQALSELGLKLEAEPDGGFYIYVDVTSKTENSLELVSDILRRVGVALTSGLDFDPKRGHSTVRFSYACSTSDLQEGIKRLRQYFSDGA